MNVRRISDVYSSNEPSKENLYGEQSGKSLSKEDAGYITLRIRRNATTVVRMEKVDVKGRSRTAKAIRRVIRHGTPRGMPNTKAGKDGRFKNSLKTIFKLEKVVLLQS